jgi:hypothetical protein
LQPAAGHWDLEIATEGTVQSNTLAAGGPARLRSQGEASFTGRKSIVVDSEGGVVLGKADIDATTHNRLVGVTTDYDWVPLVGSYTRDRALAQYRAKQYRARTEMESRVTEQASEQLDQETAAAVNRVRDRIRQRFTNKLRESGIDLTPIEMTTTEERVVARLRVAGNHQLGSHTPRPRALSDSLASVQIHETALTNSAVALGLDGGRFTAPELRDMMLEKFPDRARDDAVEASEDTIFQFAAEDAVRIHIADGRLELAIALASMVHDGHAMRNVIVHAYYVPVVDGLSAELARDGSLGIEGRISSGDRARLHNIFNSVLPPDTRLPIVQLEELAGRQLEGLMITQLVLEDGWIGLAIGPATTSRVAERSRSLR